MELYKLQLLSEGKQKQSVGVSAVFCFYNIPDSPYYKKHAAIIAPKFDVVLKAFSDELGGKGTPAP